MSYTSTSTSAVDGVALFTEAVIETFAPRVTLLGDVVALVVKLG
jgi:hypothetical protein